MTIQYSCIARGTVVLCSHQEQAGNFANTVSHMLPNISGASNGKTTYTSDNYCFHCIIDNGLIFMCVAEPNFGKQQPYLFLEEIKSKFHSRNLVVQAMKASTDEMDTDFGQTLSMEMRRFSRKGNDALQNLQSQIHDVRDVMTQNIEKVLERGERLDDLMDKTEELEACAGAFKKTAQHVSKKYWWKKTKMTIFLVVTSVVGLIIIIIIILATTGVFDSSHSSGSSTKKP